MESTSLLYHLLDFQCQEANIILSSNTTSSMKLTAKIMEIKDNTVLETIITSSEPNKNTYSKMFLKKKKIGKKEGNWSS